MRQIDSNTEGCPRTRSPEKRGKISKKNGQINNPEEKCF
jgi:hypothetical protein